MASFNMNLVVFIAIMVTSIQFYDTAAQTRHVVGDALGWTIPPGGAVAYTTWASLQTFTVGDILVFNYTNGDHDVAEVSAAAYGPCTATNPIFLATTGPTSLTLTTPGTHYYICTFTCHCQIGQKLTLNVSASTTTTPPSATPASPPTTTLTPPSTMPTTPASPPPTTPTTPEAPCPPTSSPTSGPSMAPPTIITSGPSMAPPTVITSGNNTLPPPSGGAPSFTSVVPVTLLMMGLAFWNY